LEPKVSVIIPTYNCREYLIEAIDSVLGQTYQDFEIIVVDDGSTDGTGDSLAVRYGDKVRYVWQENQRMPAARNTGIALAKGKYLAFLDSDDLFLELKLETQVNFLNTHPDIDLVIGGCEYIDESGNCLRVSQPRPNQEEIDLESIIFRGIWPIHAGLIRQNWVKQINGFDPSLVVAQEDIDFWIRLSLAGCRMAWEPKVVCQYRIHNNNVTGSYSDADHLFAMYDRIFAHPDFPGNLRARKNELYSSRYIEFSQRLYEKGFLDDAAEYIEKALELNPNLLEQKGRLLAEKIAALQENMWFYNFKSYLDFVCRVLPQPQVKELTRTIHSTCAELRFFTALRKKDNTEVRKLWLEIVRWHPAWFMNRGGLSILFQSFFGFNQEECTHPQVNDKQTLN
jgi:glycosyltransferase involved in cell wall biosynthesis